VSLGGINSNGDIGNGGGVSASTSGR